MHAHGAEDFTVHGPAISIYSLILFLVSWPSPGVLSLYPLNPLLYRPSMKIGCADRRLFSKISRWINRHIGMEWNGFAGRFPPLLAVTMTSIHMRLVLQLFSIDFLTEYKMHVYGISGYLCYFIFQLKWISRECVCISFSCKVSVLINWHTLLIRIFGVKIMMYAVVFDSYMNISLSLVMLDAKKF